MVMMGFALLAIGILYVSLECQALPGFLGPTRGDTSPRTLLGIAFLALGVLTLIATLVVRPRRPPNRPHTS